MKTVSKIGLFGGSFDPVHRGHIALARMAARELALDEVIFIPAKQPPHKLSKQLAPARHRAAMLKTALAAYPKFSISSFELRRPSTTFTYQTVEYFKKRFPRSQLFFIIGTDSLADLATWKRISHLLELCVFVAGKRPGAAAKNAIYAHSVRFLKKAAPAISSTDIRARVAANKSLAGLVSPNVASYIRSRGLYR